MSAIHSDTAQIDAALRDLQLSKDRWASLPIVERIGYLDTIKDNIVRVARPWVEAVTAAKGLTMDQPLAGEAWTGGPFAVLWLLKDLRMTLVRLSTGIPVLDGHQVRTLPSGQVAVDVFPSNFDESILFSGLTAEVWMDPGVAPDSVEDSTAAFYRGGQAKGIVSVVLGAGNISSIPVLDVVHALFTSGSVAVVKMNPLNDYLGPYFEEVFSEMIADGFVRFVYGGPDVGSHLTSSEDVDLIHVTGGASTYDAIVYGAGAEGKINRQNDAPVTTTRVTAELGGVTPVIVVPGKWTKRDLRFQAEHVVSQKMHNAGFNCVAAQTLILSKHWDQADDFLTEIRRVMSELPGREPYYPGSAERCATATASSSGTLEVFGDVNPRYLVTDLDPDAENEPWFTKEIFGPVLTVTTLAGDTVESFLEVAAEFSNSKLNGTLGANLIIDTKSQKTHSQALERAIADLQYGTVTVNVWSGAAYFMSRCPWGAFPGHTRQDIQSGTGTVHNALMFDRPQKSVVRGGFAESPRALLKGEFHIGPKLVYFVTNKQAHAVGEKLIDYCDSPSKVKLAKVAASAIRG